jgi:diadenosine tetraphosphate (Ap4A) HIT family hydrolase
MQQGDQPSLDTAPAPADCAFCQRAQITDVFKETPHFLLAADHAPLVEGHLLVIPKQHYACYGVVPASLDTEFFALKEELRQFYRRFYAPVVFWEHGVFRQTVFHAHLHCFPWGQLDYEALRDIQHSLVKQQEDLRAWYRTRGHYFYLEDQNTAMLFAPEVERYMHVVQRVFQKGLIERGASPHMLPSQQRYEQGRPLIEMVRARWLAFQRQEVS